MLNNHFNNHLQISSDKEIKRRRKEYRYVGKVPCRLKTDKFMHIMQNGNNLIWFGSLRKKTIESTSQKWTKSSD